MENDTPKALGALQVDETKLMGHVHEVVRSSVEETLNALLDAEADEICGAQRYERSPDRVDTRAGTLRAEARDEGRRCDAESAEAQEPAQLVRGGQERLGAGRDWRRSRWIPANPGRR